MAGMGSGDLDQVAAWRRAGRVAEAAGLCQALLARDPADAGAARALGEIALEAGQLEAAWALLSVAARGTPDDSAIWRAMTAVAARRGDAHGVVQGLSQVIRLDPDDGAAWRDLAGLLAGAGRVDEGLALWRRAVAVRPEKAEFHRELGNALARAGQAGAALDSYRDAVRVEPGDVAAWNSLGVALMARSGGVGEAAACFRRAVALDGGRAEIHNNLAAALRELGDLEGASDAYRAALALDPESAEIHSNYGIVLRYQGALEAAAGQYRAALALNPAYAGAHNNLGIVLVEQGHPAEAVACFARALEIDPAFANAWINLGNACSALGRVSAALDAFERARALDPDQVGPLVHERRQACDWRTFAEDEADLLAALRRGRASIVPFALLASPGATPADLRRVAERAAERIARSVPAPFVHRPDPDRRGPLRVGYLSADFHEHATAYLAAEMFERHDRARVAPFAYSFGPDDGSPMRARLERSFERFADIRTLSHRAAAEMIRADGIDILVDLKGYTRGARSGIAAWRPAPVQVNFLGYPGTMGAGFIDYIVADPVVLPMDRQPFFTERIVHLPWCCQPNDSRRPRAPENATAAVRAARRDGAGLPAAALVLCCFNNPFKVTPAFFEVWMRLLRAAPGAVLWLFDANDAVKDNLRREAAARDVDPARLVFAPRLPLADHIARLSLADLVLDCGPYGAHTTASDALWAGVPVLTCAGETFSSRVGSSLLRAAGLPELATGSLDEYETLALALIGAPARRESLRARLAASRATAPLFDAAGFARALETAFETMADLWRRGEAPRAFAVTA